VLRTYPLGYGALGADTLEHYQAPVNRLKIGRSTARSLRLAHEWVKRMRTGGSNATRKWGSDRNQREGLIGPPSFQFGQSCRGLPPRFSGGVARAMSVQLWAGFSWAMLAENFPNTPPPPRALPTDHTLPRECR
jgi:hypothetical protein